MRCAPRPAGLAPWPAASVLSSARAGLGAMLADLRLLVEQESPSGHSQAVRGSAAAVRDLVRDRLHEDAEIIEIDGVSHVRRRTDRGEVLLLGHHDTVWPLGTLNRLPFGVRHGIVRGPGCFDMKAGIVIAVHALALLAQFAGEQTSRRVGLLVTGDEEVGSRTSRALIERDAVAATAVLVLEAAADGGAVKTARKGTSAYVVHVQGRAAHAGLEPERGVNASLAVARVALAASRLADPVLQTTVTPTVMRAGTTPNTVPDQALVHLDVRAWSHAEQLRADRAIRALEAGLPGARLAVQGGPDRPPLEAAASEQLYARWTRAAAECGLPALPGARVGGASDGNITAGLGIPTLDGLGAVGGGAHADDERVELDQLPLRTAILAGLLMDLLDGTPVGRP